MRIYSTYTQIFCQVTGHLRFSSTFCSVNQAFGSTKIINYLQFKSKRKEKFWLWRYFFGFRIFSSFIFIYEYCFIEGDGQNISWSANLFMYFIKKIWKQIKMLKNFFWLKFSELVLHEALHYLQKPKFRIYFHNDTSKFKNGL